MLALLIYNKIPADKIAAKDGITLEVDKSRFVDAVEVLRQNGFPRRKTVGIQELFPSGQLVSSPEQEEAKLNYFKSQQLEKMLSSMDGVITAEVSVAQRQAASADAPMETSAAVFIKYSPEINLPAREAEIRGLILNGIPGLTLGSITLTMQRAEYRYQPVESSTPPAPLLPDIVLFKYKIPWEVVATSGGITLLGFLFSLILCFTRWSRKAT